MQKEKTVTIQGAIEELQILFNAKNVPIYYKGAIKEIIETIQMDTVPKDFHDKTCEAMAKRHTEEIQRLMRLMPKRGEWVEDGGIEKCNQCGERKEFPHWNCCPNCGARMKGADDES
jgi:hypothetical protein